MSMIINIQSNMAAIWGYPVKQKVRHISYQPSIRFNETVYLSAYRIAANVLLLMKRLTNNARKQLDTLAPQFASV